MPGYADLVTAYEQAEAEREREHAYDEDDEVVDDRRHRGRAAGVRHDRDRRAPGLVLQTIRRGLALSPELRVGLAGTLALALVAMAGRAAVPIAVQQGIDRGLRAPGGPDLDVVADHRRR